MAKRRGWTKRKRALAAKKGWQTRRKNERAKLKQWSKTGSPLIRFEGPHKRPGLTKDFDDLSDFERLALEGKQEFPEAERYSFAFRLRFIPDIESPEEYSERWVSIPFSSNLHQQVINARDYLDNFTSGRLNYGLVIPIETAILVQE